MLEYILNGGFMMWPLAALSVLSVAVIIERWSVFRNANVDDRHLRKTLFTLLGENKVDEAIALCSSGSGPVAAVLLSGLRRYRKLLYLGRAGRDLEDAVARTMSEYAPHVINALERRLNMLLMIAGVAPLLGMTGTVTGMIRAFRDMAGAGGIAGDVVAGGISEALITTATGLIIAMPAVVFYNVYTRRVDEMTLRIEESATELVDYINTSA